MKIGSENQEWTVEITEDMLNGGVLRLSWPAGYTGWRLQSQTNGPGGGLGTNWQDVPGSQETNARNFPVGAANSSTFFRLAYP